jgi:hypothetical protein
MINNSNLSEQEFVNKLISDAVDFLPPEFSEGIDSSQLEQAFHDIAHAGYHALADQIHSVRLV